MPLRVEGDRCGEILLAASPRRDGVRGSGQNCPYRRRRLGDGDGHATSFSRFWGKLVVHLSAAKGSRAHSRDKGRVLWEGRGRRKALSSAEHEAAGARAPGRAARSDIERASRPWLRSFFLRVPLGAPARPDRIRKKGKQLGMPSPYIAPKSAREARWASKHFGRQGPSDVPRTCAERHSHGSVFCLERREDAAEA